jgi:hypothetical protein
VSSLPDSYAAVHRGERLLLLRDQHPPPRELAEHLTPQPRDLEILRALWRYRFLLTSQIAREWWPGCSLQAAQRRLLAITAAGWVTRFRPRLSRGKHEWVYHLDRKGFDLGKAWWDFDGPYIPSEAKWRKRQVSDYSVVQHDLQVNAWVMAYREIVGESVVDWIGPDQGRLDVPTKYEPQARRFRPIEIEEIELRRYDYVRDLKLEHPHPVVPDATLSLFFDESEREFDLFVEFDRTRRPVKNLDKLRRYDSLLTAWWRVLDRYRGRKEAPAAVFVCPDEEAVFSLMEAAHRELTGRIGRPGTDEEGWTSPARTRTFFAAEEDVHDGSLRGWMLSPLAPYADHPRELVERKVLLPGAA